MSTLTFERPAAPRRVARPVVHRRAQAVPVPVFDERGRALTLVRDALDRTQLMTAISHAAPAKYLELRAMTRSLGYWDQERTELAENLAVEAVLDLGIVGLHNRARQIGHEVETARKQFRNGVRLHDWQAPRYWGGERRMREVSSLVDILINRRVTREWDHNPGQAPAMPTRPEAKRYQVAPGLSATADEIVSVVYGYWLYLDDDYEAIPPLVSGEIHTWFRRLAHKLWTETLVDFAVVEHNDAGTVDAARARLVEIERVALAHQLENGDELFEGPNTSLVHKFSMRCDARDRLRFIEIHLAAALGFDAYDSRARRPRMDIDGATRWPH
jgi:hypothetical protein